MAPAEVETFVTGRGLTQCTVYGREQFRVGDIAARVDGRSSLSTVVSFKGTKLHLLGENGRGEFPINGKMKEGSMDIVLHEEDSLEVTDSESSRIKVTHKRI